MDKSGERRRRKLTRVAAGLGICAIEGGRRTDITVRHDEVLILTFTISQSGPMANGFDVQETVRCSVRRSEGRRTGLRKGGGGNANKYTERRPVSKNEEKRLPARGLCTDGIDFFHGSKVCSSVVVVSK